MKDIIQKQLELKYDLKTADDELNALKEITQEVLLFSLYKVGFFEKVCFMGGTCLRIVHSLDRFSEDLDFSTRKTESQFILDDYLDRAMKVMTPYGYSLTVDSRDLKNKSVQARFIRDSSIKEVLTFKHQQDKRLKIKIKVEVDTNPPNGANEKVEFIGFPDDFQILAYDPSSLMAGKIHALLCWAYSKGRDWYDFNWYINNYYSPNLKLLENSLKQLGPWRDQDIKVDEKFVRDVLIKKINSLDWSKIKTDVRKFLLPEKANKLEMWGPDFFISKVNKLSLSI